MESVFARAWGRVVCLVALFSVLFSSVASAQVIDPDASLPIIHSVYTLSNSSSNAVLRYQQKEGKPFKLASYPTGGNGTGSFLENAGALALSPNGQWMVAVNPASDNVSLFSVAANGALTLVGQPARTTGFPIGIFPASVVISNANIAYVLFQGTPGNTGSVTAFSITSSGLQAIANSGRSLTASASNPAQIALSPSQRALVVTEGFANRIDTILLDAAGRPVSEAIINPSGGSFPFGAAFNPLGTLFVAHSVSSCLESASVNTTNGFISPNTVCASPTGQEGTSRVGVTSNSKFVYVSNSISKTISRFASTTTPPVGMLSLGASVAAQTDLNPFDISLSPATSTAPQFLYVLNRDRLSNGTPQTIQLFQVNANNGNLTFVTTITGIPFGVTGLVARL
jgi:6-phosphogluconolactonase